MELTNIQLSTPITLAPQKVTNLKLRKLILSIEAKINSMPGCLGEDPFPLKHCFAQGVYIREITIPKGMLVVGKLHRDTYFNCIMSGDMSVLTEDGVQRVKGPCWTIAPEGTKRFGYSHEDTVWITVHPNPDNITDIKTLEEQIHIKDYDDLKQVIDIGDEEMISFVKSLTADTFNVKKFRELTKDIYDHEKDGFWSDWTKEQQELYMSGDWEAFSISRGYTKEEIDSLRLWIEMKENAEAQGLNPLSTIEDLVMETALKNVSKDKRNEIHLSSHIPSSKKEPYKSGELLCQE